MAVVIELPLVHPARRINPYQLRVPNRPMFPCPLGCTIGFEEQWRLDMHLIACHPERRNAATKVTKL